MLPFHVYDVFTDTPFTGNPLAIVEDADGLSTAQMQTIARQFNLSETIFVQTPVNPAHSAKVRIFFPTAEIPFAGHPTIGCSIHLARKTQGNSLITLEEEAGLVPVTLTGPPDARRAEFTAPVIPAAHTGTAPRDLIAPALDLSEAQIGPHAPGVFSGGPAFLYVPVTDLDALAKARPMEPHWTDLMQSAHVDSAYIYTATGPNAYQGRMFSPTAGIPEDPATGSASAILAAQLLANGALPDGTTVTNLCQGVEMGRPSSLRLTTDIAEGHLTAVRVAGTAVLIAQGQIRIPA